MERGSSVTIIETPYGTFSIDTLRDAKIFASLGAGRHHQEDVLNLLLTLLPPGGVFVDAGAHIGTMSIPMAKKGDVISFEPSPQTFEFLERNIFLNGASVKAYNKGLSGAPGIAALSPRATHNAGADSLMVGEGSIPLVTLDDTVAHADLIKIDVEGMEMEVLRGGERVIRESRPAVLFEVNLSQLRAHGTSPKELEDFFRAHQYKLHIPLPTQSGSMRLGRVKNLSLVTLCVAPRATLFGVQSAPFDILALPEEHESSFTTLPFTRVLLHFIAINLRRKGQRLVRAIHHHGN